jgi:hypothetical protein
MPRWICRIRIDEPDFKLCGANITVIVEAGDAELARIAVRALLKLDLAHEILEIVLEALP